jgi:hypothetical protein
MLLLKRYRRRPGFAVLTLVLTMKYKRSMVDFLNQILPLTSMAVKLIVATDYLA